MNVYIFCTNIIPFSDSRRLIIILILICLAITPFTHRFETLTQTFMFHISSIMWLLTLLANCLQTQRKRCLKLLSSVRYGEIPIHRDLSCIKGIVILLAAESPED